MLSFQSEIKVYRRFFTIIIICHDVQISNYTSVYNEDLNLNLSIINIFQKSSWSQKDNELVAFLQLQLAEAINLQDRSLIAHLHETLRCVRLFDSQGYELFR